MARPLILFGVLLYTAGTLSMKTLDHVTVREGGSITIPCLYDNQYKQNTKYWCEGYFWNYCKITASTNAIRKWTITDYPADSIFTVKLNNLKSSDSKYYWCAIIGNHAEPDDRKYLYVTVKKAPDVSVVNSSVSGHEGGDISVQCFYSSGYKNEVKQWCRYKDQSCYTVGRTNTSQNSSVQISDDGRRSFTVLMTGLRLTDFGWYYCSVGDLQVPVHLLVQRDNESKSMSESDDAGQFPSTCKNQTASKDSEDSKCSPNDPSDQMDWIFLLLYTAVPLLLLLMLVLVIWRLVQKHNGALTKRGPDICSVAEGQKAVTYDTVVFKKANKHEPNQVSISHSPEQFEVIYSTLNLHQ
ncbi:CMRF35-like molecule 1 isoform X2 [Carassius gibelio]|uniref:CMRF35-like molecule 1 isoform X2 n=1 Tax=Carassius gibelio TaxID=101364 RepID=UPI0022780EF0|nr:CMRF35-like molecule 1 isoform X2 [Carassius gibelio]